MRSVMLGISATSAVALACLVAVSTGQTQTTSNTSNYIFRFNTGVSGTFLSDMTFPNQQPLNLGTCTVTEKINGPLSCAMNCQNQSVCLLQVSGPSGSGVSDVLEKVSETPVGAGTPTPTASPTAAGAPPSAFGSLIQSPVDGTSDVSRRIQLYNSMGH